MTLREKIVRAIASESIITIESLSNKVNLSIEETNLEINNMIKNKSLLKLHDGVTLNHKGINALYSYSAKEILYSKPHKYTEYYIQ